MNLKQLKLDALAKQLGNLDKDDVLDVLGLETRRDAGDYLIPGLLVFGAGIAVGAGWASCSRLAPARSSAASSARPSVRASRRASRALRRCAIASPMQPSRCRTDVALLNRLLR